MTDRKEESLCVRPCTHMPSTNHAVLCTECGFPSGSQSALFEPEHHDIQTLQNFVIVDTNEPLPDQQDAEVRRNLASAHDTLEILTDRIQETGNLMARLGTHYERVRAYIDEHRTFVNPLRRLPADVIEHIGFACMQFDGNRYEVNNFVDSLDTTEAPWVLAQVSRRWRDAILSCPQLWNEIGLDIDAVDHTSPRVVASAIFRLGLQLERARKSTYLTFSLRCLHEDSLPGYHRLLDLALPTSSRWKIVSINLPLSLFFVLSPVEGFLGSLRVIYLSYPWETVQEDTERDVLPPPVSLFRFAPSLHTLSFQGCPAVCHTFIDFPWSQLIRFSWVDNLEGEHYCDNRHLIQVLQRTPILESCTLECSSSDDGLLDVEPIILPSLHSLTLDDHDVRDGTTGVISRLTLPSLEYACLIDVGENSVVSLYHLVERSACPLSTLRLVVVEGHEDVVLELLSILTSLEDLSIDVEIHTAASVISSLFLQLPQAGPDKDPPPPILLPNLTSLKLDVQGGIRQGLDISSFVNMAESRWRIPSVQGVNGANVAQLQYARLGGDLENEDEEDEDDLLDSVVGRLQILFGEGLDIDINDNRKHILTL